MKEFGLEEGVRVPGAPLTALFTKPPVSRFPALPGTIPPFHCSICEAVNEGMASGGHSCRWYFWEQPVTKELVALRIALLQYYSQSHWPYSSWPFHDLTGTSPSFHCSNCEAVNGGHSCHQYFWEWPVTKEPAAL